MSSAVALRAKVRNKIGKEPQATFSESTPGIRGLILGGTITLFALMLAMVFLSPLGYMSTTAIKSTDQITDETRPLLPKSPSTAIIDGQERKILAVPLPGGQTKDLALVKPGRSESTFVDPSDPGTKIVWKGQYRTLKAGGYHLAPHFENLSKAWTAVKIPILLRNTLIIAILGMIGTVIASTLVAYGLSRFRVPGAGFIMGSLVAAIILPRFLTIVPMYAIYQHVGFIGTWIPLILPHFFGNAYNVFLLRQFFMTIPKEMDEAAALDGAGPLRTLMLVIVPQARPAIITVAILHFLFVWNDFLEPLVFLTGKNNLMPFSVGLFQFLGLYAAQVSLLQAGALLGMIIPIIVFVFSQRFFLKGIDLSGASKG